MTQLEQKWNGDLKLSEKIQLKFAQLQIVGGGENPDGVAVIWDQSRLRTHRQDGKLPKKEAKPPAVVRSTGSR